MAKEKKKAEPKPHPEKYEKRDLAINGTFDDTMNVFFAKDKVKKIKKDSND